MKLTNENLENLTAIAIRAARKAGKHISETRPLQVQHKPSGDSLASQVLTEVDGQSQEMVLEILKPTFTEFDLALLTEERADDGSRLEKDYFWCIDPIDGTLPFIEGIPGYAVSIALISNQGVPQIGVVFDPVEQTLYHAILGQGAFRNSKPWSIGDRESRLQIFTDRSTADQSYVSTAAMELQAEIHATGGGVMNALWCLENPPACYFKFPKTTEGGGSLWDFAATACIYNEIGAVATDIHGQPLDLNRCDSSYMNHRGILYATDETLAEQLRKWFKAYIA
jgi:3'(2'), 5'-bisphosphate nucleotidase/myo-inositol-1(or 4)-monophosphatase